MQGVAGGWGGDGQVWRVGVRGCGHYQGAFSWYIVLFCTAHMLHKKIAKTQSNATQVGKASFYTTNALSKKTSLFGKIGLNILILHI